MKQINIIFGGTIKKEQKDAIEIGIGRIPARRQCDWWVSCDPKDFKDDAKGSPRICCPGDIGVEGVHLRSLAAAWQYPTVLALVLAKYLGAEKIKYFGKPKFDAAERAAIKEALARLWPGKQVLI